MLPGTSYQSMDQDSAVDRDIVVIGASAGQLALKKLAAALPRDFPAAMFVVLHIPPEPGASCRKF